MQNVNPAWFGLMLLVAVVLGWVVQRFRAGNRAAPDDPRYHADRVDPVRRWAHGALAAYRGFDLGDPGHWSVEDATSEVRDSWSTPDRAALLELLARYEGDEINVAFDKARLVW